VQLESTWPTIWTNTTQTRHLISIKASMVRYRRPKTSSLEISTTHTTASVNSRHEIFLILHKMLFMFKTWNNLIIPRRKESILSEQSIKILTIAEFLSLLSSIALLVIWIWKEIRKMNSHICLRIQILMLT